MSPSLTAEIQYFFVLTDCFTRRERRFGGQSRRRVTRAIAAALERESADDESVGCNRAIAGLVGAESDGNDRKTARRQ